MRLPPEIQFYEDAHLLVYRPHGLLNEASVNKVISLIEDLEEKLKEPFDRFFDTVAADAVDLNFEYIIRVSLYRRAFYGERPPIKSAIFATDPAAIHYATLHAVVTQGSPIKVRVFEDRQKAAQRLNMPIELLTAATSGDTRSPGTK